MRRKYQTKTKSDTLLSTGKEKQTASKRKAKNISTPDSKLARMIVHYISHFVNCQYEIDAIAVQMENKPSPQGKLKESSKTLNTLMKIYILKQNHLKT